MGIYQLDCAYCGSKYDITETVCPSCGENTPGTINTRRATIPIEREALEKRYQMAIDYLKANALDNEGGQLEKEVQNTGKAVLNTQLAFLWEWLILDTKAYKSYRRQLNEGIRTSALFNNDVSRSTADSILFGSAIDIIYAALTLDETGLLSYGAFTIVLKNSAIEKRTSALETNSYPFLRSVAKAGWMLGDPLPAGFMSSWYDLPKLSLAKLYLKITNTLNHSDRCLLIQSPGDRATDEFIELYIFGNIVAANIEKIRVPAIIVATLTDREKLQIEEIKRKFTVELF